MTTNPKICATTNENDVSFMSSDVRDGSATEFYCTQNRMGVGSKIPPPQGRGDVPFFSFLLLCFPSLPFFSYRFIPFFLFPCLCCQLLYSIVLRSAEVLQTTHPPTLVVPIAIFMIKVWRILWPRKSRPHLPIPPSMRNTYILNFCDVFGWGSTG